MLISTFIALKRWLNKFGAVVLVLTLVELLLLYYKPTRYSVLFPVIAPPEHFYKYYPRFWLPVLVVAKIHLPLLVATSLWYVVSVREVINDRFLKSFFILLSQHRKRSVSSSSQFVVFLILVIFSEQYFSSYPTYSAIVPDECDYIYFEVYNRQGAPMQVYDLGKEAGFRMESYTPIEENIYNNVQRNDSAAMRMNVQRLWNVWVANVPALKQADSVAVYLRKSPVAPERVNDILENKYLMSIKF